MQSFSVRILERKIKLCFKKNLLRDADGEFLGENVFIILQKVGLLCQNQEILKALEDNWFSWGAVNPAHPSRFEKVVADKFVRQARLGVPIGLNSMAVAGATAPVTVAGYVVVASAEIIATWIAARALNPKVPLTGAIWAGTIDMRTGQVSYSAFDAMLRAFAVVEFLRRWCGITIRVGGGEYCNARKVGLYAALEKAYKAMMIAAFTGCHPPLGEGMIECGKTLSPVQLLLERELGVSLKHFGKSIEVTPETINLDEIIEVGFGFEKTYLESKNTLNHFRSSLSRGHKEEASPLPVFSKSIFKRTN